MAAIEKNNPLQSIQSILDITKGKGTTTQTTSSNISSEGVNALLQQILQSNQGLASVASGQKTAGLYNSTVNQQMINDLITRASGEVAKQQAGTTTRTKQAGQIDPTTAILGLVGSHVAGKLLGPTLSGISKKAGLDDMGAKIAESLGFGSGAGGGAALSLGEDAGAAFADLGGGGGILGGEALTLGGGAEAGLAGVDFLSAGAGTAGALEAGAEIGALTLGADAAATAAAIGGTEAALAAGAAEGALTLGGSAAATEAAITGVGAAAEGAGLWETIATAAAAWIICTELTKQGRMPKRFYVYGSKVFADYPEDGKKGYYIWAIPSVKHLRKYPNSLYSKFLCAIFNWRAEYLAAKAGCKGARKLWRGAVVTHASYYFCLGLSKFIPKSYSTNWEKLYART